MRAWIFAVIAGVCVAETAGAAIVELSLPCEGRYDWQTPGCTVNFDLGVEFSEISRVYIEWSGEMMGWLVTDMVTPAYRPPYPINMQVFFDLGSNPSIRGGTVKGGRITYPEPEQFDRPVDMTLPDGSTWSDLLDGTGQLTLWTWHSSAIEVRSVEPGYIYVRDIAVVVEGTVVPEPMSFIYLSFGAIVTLRRCRGERV